MRNIIAHLVKRLLSDRAGATAIEYGLIISLVVIVMVTALAGLADTTIGMWTNVSDNVQAHTPQ